MTDELGYETVSLVAGSDHYNTHLHKIIVGTCVRIEGAVVVPRALSDGGSIDYSLQVDATTSISPIPSFETTLFFVPELSIKTFLAKASRTPSIKSTIAFVIVQVDSVRKSKGSMFEQLTIVDDRLPIDRATVCFVFLLRVSPF